MITLMDSETNQAVGQVSEAQWRFLMAHLEEESTQDRDYYISQDELDILEESGADEALVKTLRAALAGREGADFCYVQERQDTYRGNRFLNHR